MNLQYNPSAIPLFLIVTILVWLTGMAWQRRPGASLKPLVAFNIGITAWLLGYALELMSVDFATMFFWVRVQYFGLATVPIFWLIFTLTFTGGIRYLAPGALWLLFVIPVVTNVLAWTNPLHGLIWKQVGMDTSGIYPAFERTYGGWFWVHTAFSYGGMFAAGMVLVGALFRAPALYRGQLLVFLVAMLFPWSANAIDIAGMNPLGNFDLSTVGFAIAYVLTTWSLFRFRLFDIVPTAYDRVIESLDDMVIVLDRQDRVIDVNPAVQTATGMMRDSAIGQPVERLIAGQQNLLQQYDATEKVQAEVGFVLDGVQRYFDMHITPLYSRRGRVAGRVIMLREITEFKTMARNLAQARDEALESSRLKSEFLAIMSHELRTPLNGVIGMSELLLETELDDEQQEFAQVVLREGRALLRLITDILDLSRIEAKRFALETRVFSVHSLIDDIAAITAKKASAKNLSLNADVPAGIPALLQGDPVRLQQVILNLLSNAIKFTAEGGITLAVLLDAQTRTHVVIRVVVTDTGVGIPAVAQRDLFQPFTQADSSSTRRYGGAGLGLTICKRLVELMGGEIGVRSIEGQGAKFWFAVPLMLPESVESDPALPLQDVPDELPVQPPTQTGKRVLVVEDSQSNQIVAEAQLRQLGHQAEVVPNGREAVNAITVQGDKYDLILMDGYMPEMDGFAATEAIRRFEREASQRTPIVAMTASAMIGDRERYLAAGMDDYLSKPVQLDDLRKVLARWL